MRQTSAGEWFLLGTVWLCLGASAISASACGDPADDAAGTDADVPPPSYIYFQDANNYTFVSTLDIPSVETAATDDIEICWDGLTKDFQCHEMDPAADIAEVSLVRFYNRTEQDISDALSRGDLAQAETAGFLDFPTDGDKTCANLSAFTMRGTVVDVAEEYTVDANTTYLLIVTNDTRPGVGARMMTFIHPSETSEVQRVDIVEDCDVLSFDADLAGLTKVRVPKTVPLTLDWSEISRNGQGITPSFGSIDAAKLGFYKGLTAEDLEARIVDLFLIADKMWTLELNGDFHANLAEAADENGNAFTTFEGDGTWVFTLTCSTCQNPSPQFVTVFEPVEQ